MTVDFNNPLPMISSEGIRLIARGVEQSADQALFEDVSETARIELTNFINQLRSELQHRGDFNEF